MHSQDPRTKTALAPSIVRTGDGAVASCWPARKSSKRRRPSNPVNRLNAATPTPRMPLESFIVRSSALAQGLRQTHVPLPDCWYTGTGRGETNSVAQGHLQLLAFFVH